MAGNQNPKSPNYTSGVGRLVTDRYDFQKHINGIDFRHNATQIDLSPVLSLNSQTLNSVQEALVALIAQGVPTIQDATTSTKGIIQLAGDLAGPGTTAAVPKVSGLQGYPISNAAPGVGQLLNWTGGAWTPTSALLPTSIGSTNSVVSYLGGQNVSNRSITTDLIVDSSSIRDFIILSNFSVSHTITLPLASAGKRLLIIKDIGGNLSPTVTMTIARSGSDNIENIAGNYVATSPLISIILFSDGTSNWFILN